MTTTVTDQRHQIEAIAYQAISFPGMSAEDTLADIAPHLSAGERDSAFSDLVDGIGLRGTAVRACEAVPACVAEILTKWVTPKVAVRAAGTLYPELLVAAKVVAAIQARNWDAIVGLDRDVDGARDELLDLTSCRSGASEYPDADPELLEQLAEEKVTAALANLAFVAEHRLEQLLVDFAVSAWRFTSDARMRLTGGA
ncbi:hypothetical protein [Actinomadura sp. GTD37]|uniref:hypothetical protein n=1 Tax=Actinomadura sp. GTD37 TaxID=1778030 RepID=UPI0035C050D0